MDGRDEETMDMIIDDLKGAAHGLPVEFDYMPFDTPMIQVYVNDEHTGMLVWSTDTRKPEQGYQWVSVSIVPTPAKVTWHGNSVRAALAAHLNVYVDKRIGLL